MSPWPNLSRFRRHADEEKGENRPWSVAPLSHRGGSPSVGSIPAGHPASPARRRIPDEAAAAAKTASAIGAIPGEWATAAALIQLVHNTQHPWLGGWLTRLARRIGTFTCKFAPGPLGMALVAIQCQKYFRSSETFRRSAKTMLDPSRVAMACWCLCLYVDSEIASSIL